VVGGYVHKHVTLQISKGLRVVALAAGISRRVLCDTRVMFSTIIAIYPVLAEKIRTPLISHDRASEDAGRGVVMTSSRSSIAGSALAFTMPLVPLALRCFSWFSPTSYGR
jgi:hypothetical protein